MIGPFEAAKRSTGTVRATSKEAFIAGSSKARERLTGVGALELGRRDLALFTRFVGEC